MKFRETSIAQFKHTLEKIERYFAFKYEVPKGSIALIFKDKVIHILVNGRLKESIIAEHLPTLGIKEEDGSVKGSVK